MKRDPHIAQYVLSRSQVAAPNAIQTTAIRRSTVMTTRRSGRSVARTLTAHNMYASVSLAYIAATLSVEACRGQRNRCCRIMLALPSWPGARPKRRPEQRARSSFQVNGS